MTSVKGARVVFNFIFVSFHISIDVLTTSVSDPDPGKSRILYDKKRKKNEPFFLKFNILFLDFDAALT